MKFYKLVCFDGQHGSMKYRVSRVCISVANIAILALTRNKSENDYSGPFFNSNDQFGNIFYKH